MEGSYRFPQTSVNMVIDPYSQRLAGPPRAPREAMMDEMAGLSRQNRVPEMAWLFLQTCPGDWDCGWGPTVRSTLARAVRKELPAAELNEVAATIRFRWELALYADHLVKTFGLPAPGGEICILWDFKKWCLEVVRGQHGQHSAVWNMLVQGGIKPDLLDHDGCPFDRFLHYMVAAVTLANLPEGLLRALTIRLGQYTAGEHGFLQRRARARQAGT